MAIEFGKKLVCKLCRVPLNKDNISPLSNAHCKYCKPPKKREKIEKYRGLSNFYKKDGYAGD